MKITTMINSPEPTVRLVASNVNKIMRAENNLCVDVSSLNKLILVDISGMLLINYIPTQRLLAARK